MTTTVQRSFCVRLSNQSSPLARALEQVFSRLGQAQKVNDMSDAHLVFTDSVEGSLAALKEGCCVIQLAISATGGSEDETALKLFFHDRFRVVSSVSSMLVDCLKCINELEPQMSARHSIDFDSVEPATDVAGFKILVVDDSRQNRDLAKAQLSQNNSLTVVSSYRTALQVINTAEDYDIVLSDLLMPTEGFTLGQVRDQVVGTPFPAGMYVVLAALQKRIARIALVTTGDHHDDAHIAALDFITGSTTTTDSKLVVEKRPNMIEGGKDWAAVVRRLT